jgi:hypothetical protein
LGNSPAAVNPSTGILYINPLIWPRLSEDEKDQIIFHELGHLKGYTTNEMKADEIAHQLYTSGKEGKKRSLKSTVYLLQKILPSNHPRIEAQLLRAEKTDRQ